MRDTFRFQFTSRFLSLDLQFGQFEKGENHQERLGPVVRQVDNATDFPNIYPLDRDLSGLIALFNV